MTIKDSHTILRSEIDEIFEFMGARFDVEVQFFDESFGVRVPTFLQPRFWVAVATWFCEQEHRSALQLPDWTPIDLASDAMVADTPDHLYFDSFDFVEDL